LLELNIEHVCGLGGLSMCIIKLLELNIEHVCGLGGLSMCIIKLLELNIEHVCGLGGLSVCMVTFSNFSALSGLQNLMEKKSLLY
jgi:hypothetical protein